MQTNQPKSYNVSTLSERVSVYIKEKEAAMNIDWFEIELETMAIKLGVCVHCLKRKLAKEINK